MIPNILTKIFGSRNERLLKQYAQVVRQINALEPGLANLSDPELKAKTPRFKQPVANAEDSRDGTNNEFGCHYPRDTLVFSGSQGVKRHPSYPIVDEVKSILIDEARTPLIISGQADDNIDLYYRLNELAPKLVRQAEET